ncbi:Crp/Fnr family transcriptional regulator [Sphingomonas sp. MMS24-J13]|uniref:Crp/Fnr family transcriptional regulator n=1 Tax=Sphingomonas sp. MMS24-J13 TaxID=3238686 RepID=UPI00384AD932
MTADEHTALDGLLAGERSYRKGTIIRAERASSGEMFVVRRGWLFCSMLLEDGRRQIIRFHLRGDLLGGDSLAFAEAPDAIVALTDCEVQLIDKARLGRLFAEQPRLAALLFAMLQVDRVLLTDRLTSLGRSSAKGRVAALLLWIANRAKMADPAAGDRIPVPMTQEEIGDATGLTAVHVNRTMRALVEQGLIARSSGAIRILDTARLSRVANHVPRKERLEPNWLTTRS